MSLLEELRQVLELADGNSRPRQTQVLLSNRLRRPVTDQEFAELVDEAISQGIVRRVRGGPGGALALLPPAVDASQEPKAQTITGSWSQEAALMPHLGTYLATVFRSTESGLAAQAKTWVVDTSNGGPTGSGPWSRPDFTMAAVTHHRFTVPAQLDLFAFELKPENRCDIRSVHEAAAHARFVHYAFLVWHLPLVSPKSRLKQTMREYCSELGIGMITFDDPQDVSSFTVQLDPIRRSPSPEAIDSFLTHRVPTQICKEIEAALRV